MTDRVSLALDVGAWDSVPFADAVAEQERVGIAFRSLAELNRRLGYVDAELPSPP